MLLSIRIIKRILETLVHVSLLLAIILQMIPMFLRTPTIVVAIYLGIYCLMVIYVTVSNTGMTRFINVIRIYTNMISTFVELILNYVIYLVRKVYQLI